MTRLSFFGSVVVVAQFCAGPARRCRSLEVGSVREGASSDFISVIPLLRKLPVWDSDGSYGEVLTFCDGRLLGLGLGRIGLSDGLLYLSANISDVFS